MPLKIKCEQTQTINDDTTPATTYYIKYRRGMRAARTFLIAKLSSGSERTDQQNTFYSLKFACLCPTLSLILFLLAILFLLLCFPLRRLSFPRSNWYSSPIVRSLRGIPSNGNSTHCLTVCSILLLHFAHRSRVLYTLVYNGARRRTASNELMKSSKTFLRFHYSSAIGQLYWKQLKKRSILDSLSPFLTPNSLLASNLIL